MKALSVQTKPAITRSPFGSTKTRTNGTRLSIVTTSENKQEPRCTQTFQKSQQLGDDTSAKSSYCAQLEGRYFFQQRAMWTLTCLPSVTGYINKKSVRAKGSQWGGGNRQCRASVGGGGAAEQPPTNKFFLYISGLFLKVPFSAKPTWLKWNRATCL